MGDETRLIIDEAELFELYSTLADATEAAATGDRNECASLASEAKEEVKRIRAEAEVADDA